MGTGETEEAIFMSTTTWILIAGLIVIALVGIAVWIFFQKRRTERLRVWFGPEYARELEETGDRRHAEAKLEEREKRVEHLHIRSLTPGDRARFADSWRVVQAR